MSCEKVQEFLEKTKKEKEKEEAQLRYEVLSHFNLGEKIERKEGDNSEDYPLEDPSGGKFRYDCDITEDDFLKIKAAYEKETRAIINDKSEITLNVCAVVLLILGIIVFAILSFVAFDNESWTLFGIGAGVFFSFLIEFAFAKVLVNISRKLDKFRE